MGFFIKIISTNNPQNEKKENALIFKNCANLTIFIFILVSLFNSNGFAQTGLDLVIMQSLLGSSDGSNEGGQGGDSITPCPPSLPDVTAPNNINTNDPFEFNNNCPEIHSALPDENGFCPGGQNGVNDDVDCGNGWKAEYTNICGDCYIWNAKKFDVSCNDKIYESTKEWTRIEYQVTDPQGVELCFAANWKIKEELITEIEQYCDCCNEIFMEMSAGSKTITTEIFSYCYNLPDHMFPGYHNPLRRRSEIIFTYSLIWNEEPACPSHFLGDLDTPPPYINTPNECSPEYF